MVLWAAPNFEQHPLSRMIGMLERAKMSTRTRPWSVISTKAAANSGNMWKPQDRKTTKIMRYLGLVRPVTDGTRQPDGRHGILSTFFGLSFEEGQVKFHIKWIGFPKVIALSQFMGIISTIVILQKPNCTLSASGHLENSHVTKHFTRGWLYSLIIWDSDLCW